jgi:TIR domain
MADIFISYAREDAATAERLAHALEEHGWSVFWDRHIPAGRNFDAFILEQIRAAACMIVLWSRAACESEWVLEEANEGRQRRILVPARIDNVDPPFGFSRIQCADVIGWRSAKNGGDLSPLINALSVPVSQSTTPSADDSTFSPPSPAVARCHKSGSIPAKADQHNTANVRSGKNDLINDLILLVLALTCTAATLMAVLAFFYEPNLLRLIIAIRL